MSRGAVHNALSRGPLAAGLSRIVGDAEGSLGLERYGETLTPVIDMWSRPEFSYPRHERICQGFAEMAAGGAGVFSTVNLCNPTGSGMIVVVDAAMGNVSVAAAGLCLVHFPCYIGGALVAQSNSRDGRWASTNYPVAYITTGELLILGGIPASIGAAYLANENYPAIAGPFVVCPGQALSVSRVADNLSLRMTYAWRERLAFPGELG